MDMYTPQESIRSTNEIRASSTNTDLGATASRGWINTVPLSASTNTLSKRSSATRPKRVVNADVYVKEYTKKRNLILDLLVRDV